MGGRGRRSLLKTMRDAVPEVTRTPTCSVAGAEGRILASFGLGQLASPGAMSARARVHDRNADPHSPTSPALRARLHQADVQRMPDICHQIDSISKRAFDSCNSPLSCVKRTSKVHRFGPRRALVRSASCQSATAYDTDEHASRYVIPFFCRLRHVARPGSALLSTSSPHALRLQLSCAWQ